MAATTQQSAAEWTALVLEDNGGVRDDGHWHAEHCPGAPAFPCHCMVIENEMSDYRMILDHCTEVYDEASGGRVSKPNTLPSVVLDFMREDRSKDVDEAVAEAREEWDAQLAAAEAMAAALEKDIAFLEGRPCLREVGNSGQCIDKAPGHYDESCQRCIVLYEKRQAVEAWTTAQEGI